MTIEEKYKNRKPIGYAPDSAFSGILLFELDKEDSYDGHDYVVCEEINGNRLKFQRHKIRYDKKGEPYISKMERKFYLKDILRY